MYEATAISITMAKKPHKRILMSLPVVVWTIGMPPSVDDSALGCFSTPATTATGGEVNAHTSAIIQPSNVKPRRRFNTKIAPVLW